MDGFHGVKPEMRMVQRKRLWNNLPIKWRMEGMNLPCLWINFYYWVFLVVVPMNSIQLPPSSLALPLTLSENTMNIRLVCSKFSSTKAIHTTSILFGSITFFIYPPSFLIRLATSLHTLCTKKKWSYGCILLKTIERKWNHLINAKCISTIVHLSQSNHRIYRQFPINNVKRNTHAASSVMTPIWWQWDVYRFRITLPCVFNV